MANNLTKATTLVIEDDAISEEKIIDAAITSNEVADNSANDEHYQAGSFTADKINNSAINGDKIAPLAIGTSKIADASVTKEKLTQDPFIQKGIILWVGDSIPTGWALCDGTNGTPDLTNRFIVGAGDTYSIGDTGGTNTITTVAGGGHTHTGSTSAAGSHSHTGNTGYHTLGASEIAPHRHLLVYAISPGSRTGIGSAAHSVNSQNANGGYHEEYVLASTATEPVWGRTSLPYTSSFGYAGGGVGHRHSLTAQGTHNHTITLDGVDSHTHDSIDSRPRFFDLKFIMKL